MKYALYVWPILLSASLYACDKNFFAQYGFYREKVHEYAQEQLVSLEEDFYNPDAHEPRWNRWSEALGDSSDYIEHMIEEIDTYTIEELKQLVAYIKQYDIIFISPLSYAIEQRIQKVDGKNTEFVDKLKQMHVSMLGTLHSYLIIVKQEIKAKINILS